MRNAAAGLVLVLAAVCAPGDQLVILGQAPKEGTFQGFENGRFLFLPANGKFMKEQSSRVSKIVLPTPGKASYQTTDGKTEQEAAFKGYEKGKFVFVKDGKEVLIPALRMKQLEPTFESEGGVGGDGGVGSYPIPKVDLSSIGDVTPDQQAILDRFATAKKAFDDYLTASIAMKEEMDKLKGPKREELLNKLRLRKDAEQPLRKDLRTAYKALVSAFSEQDEAAKPVEKPASKAAGGLRSLSK
jgi:hypothetical protein